VRNHATARTTIGAAIVSSRDSIPLRLQSIKAWDVTDCR
jgi:hypothetical protein